MSITRQIIDFESGEMTTEEQIKLFAILIKSGMAWSLQGSYGRTASYLIDTGVIDRGGEINWDAFAVL